MKKKIYIVIEENGVPSDWEYELIGAFFDENVAYENAKNFNRQQEEQYGKRRYMTNRIVMETSLL